MRKLGPWTITEERDQVVINSFNSLGDGRYYDTSSQSSFAFDHATQKASSVQSHVTESKQSDLVYV